MYIRIGVLLLLAAAASPSFAQDGASASAAGGGSSTMSQGAFTSSAGLSFGYWLYTPDDAAPGMPLIVYLHGGSGRGSDLSLVISGSLPKFLYEGSVSDVSAYVLMPQLPANRTWEQIEPSVMELIARIDTDLAIDSDRISLTGHSLGGSGTWRLGASQSAVFSAIAPLSGSVNASNAQQYVGIPVWAVVGSADTIVDPSTSQAIVPRINELGGNARITTYQGATHFDVPDLAYKDPQINLLGWLISQVRGGPVSSEPEAERARPLVAGPNPTAGSLTLSYSLLRAGAVRLIVYDAIGRAVDTVVGGVESAGPHATTLDVSGLPAGVYVAHLVTEGGSEAVQFTVVR